jgi:ribose 5-phosphate isomerase RpiB
MPSNSFSHVAGILATAILVSIVTAGAAIAASGIGHALSARTMAGCASANCAQTPQQARPGHIAKAAAAIAMRGNRN